MIVHYMIVSRMPNLSMMWIRTNTYKFWLVKSQNQDCFDPFGEVVSCYEDIFATFDYGCLEGTYYKHTPDFE